MHMDTDEARDIGIDRDTSTEHQHYERGQEHGQEIERETSVKLARNLAYAPDVVENPFNLEEEPDDSPKERESTNHSHYARLCDMDDVARLVQDSVDEFGIAREYVVGQFGELVVHAETTAHGEDEGGERDYGEGGEIAQCNALESHPLLSEGVESDADELDETDYPAPDAGQAFRVQLP